MSFVIRDPKSSILNLAISSELPMTLFRTPAGMTRRHFLSHLAGASALALPAMSLTHSFEAHAADLKKRGKSAILLWMGGGPSTIDIWDLKQGAPPAANSPRSTPTFPASKSANTCP